MNRQLCLICKENKIEGKLTNDEFKTIKKSFKNWELKPIPEIIENNSNSNYSVIKTCKNCQKTLQNIKSIRDELKILCKSLDKLKSNFLCTIWKKYSPKEPFDILGYSDNESSTESEPLIGDDLFQNVIHLDSSPMSTSNIKTPTPKKKSKSSVETWEKSPIFKKTLRISLEKINILSSSPNSQKDNDNTSTITISDASSQIITPDKIKKEVEEVQNYENLDNDNTPISPPILSPILEGFNNQDYIFEDNFEDNNDDGFNSPAPPELISYDFSYQNAPALYDEEEVPIKDSKVCLVEDLNLFQIQLPNNTNETPSTSSNNVHNDNQKIDIQQKQQQDQFVQQKSSEKKPSENEDTEDSIMEMSVLGNNSTVDGTENTDNEKTPIKKTNIKKPVEKKEVKVRYAALVKCPFEECGKMVRSNVLKSHTRYHDEAKFPCQFCGRFYNKIKLQTHIACKHKLKLQCEVCSKEFTNKFALKAHNLSHVKDKARHLCNICGRTYAYANDLGKHVRKCSQKEPNIQCPKCPKRFYDKRGVAWHMSYGKCAGKTDNL